MKYKPPTVMSWSLLELAGLLEDEDSHVHYGKTKKHLGLHPFHLTNLSVALNDILRSNLNSYDTELQGFLLAYKNPKLLTALGDTFYDSCFIHVDIEADFYVFKPEVGHTVKGIVNKKGYNHIGVVLHKTFNVSIPRVLDGGQWPGDMIEIGQEVKFTITHIDLNGRLPFIRGSLNRANYLEGCKLFATTNKKKKKKTTNESFYDRDNESDNSCDSKEEKYQSKKLKELKKQVSPEKYSKKKRHIDDVDTADGETKKHSKKRLKISQELNHSEYEVKNNVSYESSNDNVNNVNNIDIVTSTKKKKRSEKTSKKKSVEDSQISETEFDCSTVKVKVEKDLTSNSDSENAVKTELKKSEKKSKAQSKRSRYSDSTSYSIDNEEIQENIKLEHKRHSKKHTLPNSDINGLGVKIKVEESPESDNINEYHLDNLDVANHQRKSSKKRIKKSVTDFESEIGNVQIKEEKNTSESEHTQEEDRKDKISKIIKTEKLESKSSRSRNNSESENYLNGSPTKHKIKREKTPVVDFEEVTIKKEKLDDKVKYEYDTQYESNEKKLPKKSKDIYAKSKPEEIKIKEEKHKIKSESEDEKDSRKLQVIHEKIHKATPKKHIKNEFLKNESDNSTAEESEQTRYNIFSPSKRSKKSKEPRYKVPLENVEIKIERSSSVES